MAKKKSPAKKIAPKPKPMPAVPVDSPIKRIMQGSKGC